MIIFRGGFKRGGGGGGGPGGPNPPLSYMKNDVMDTVIYACYCPWICKLANRSSQAGSMSI